MDTRSESQSSSQLIKSLKFCVFDLETTGGDHKQDKIIEIGMVQVEGLKITKEKDLLIQPEIKIPEFIQKLTSISQDDVEDAPTIEDSIDEILDFMGDSILVAHNTSFDIPFFNSILTRLKKPSLENKALCTNLMTKYLIPNLMNSNLNYMSKIFGIRHTKAHRALDDARATAKLLINYLNIFIDKGIKKTNHLYYPRNRYELDQLNMKAEDGRDQFISELQKVKSPFLITLKSDSGVILFSYPFSKASEKEFLIENIQKLPYYLATIKLYGPFLEAMSHFSSHFNKIDHDIRYSIMNLLWQTHLPQKIQSSKFKTYQNQADQSKQQFQIDDDLKDDFIISNHLVPDQYIIYPIKNWGHKNELIFRFPAHKKKLLQFIRSRSQITISRKVKNNHHHFYIKEFMNEYIREISSKQAFTFNSQESLKDENIFFKKLDDYLRKNKNPYNYPKDHI